MLIFELLEDDRGVIHTIKLSNGMEFNNIPAFEKFLRSEEMTLHGEGLHGLMVAMKSAGVKVNVKAKTSKGLTSRMMIGKGATLVDVSQWGMNVNTSTEGIAALKKIEAIDPEISDAPSRIVNQSWSKAMGDDEASRRSRWAPTLLEAYLSSSKLPDLGFRPAYGGGMLACPAEPKEYSNVNSFDITSAFPYSAVTTLVPMGSGRDLKPEEFSELEITNGELSLKPGIGFIGLFVIKGARRKPWVSIPMLRSEEERGLTNPVVDQVGVVSGDFRLALCPDSLKLIDLQYEYDSIEIEELSIHALGPIPEKAKGFILDAYKKKKELVKGTTEREAAKLNLNTIIGFWGSDPFKSLNKMTSKDGVNYKGLVGKIENGFKYYAGSKGRVGWSAGLARTWDFRWAVYTINATRLRIALADKACYEAGVEVLYSDTDSLKVNGPTKLVKEVFDKLNQEVIETLDYLGLGLWADETDGNHWGAFRGVKSYAVGNTRNENVASISGIPKEDMIEVMRILTLEEFADRTLELAAPARKRYNGLIENDPFGAKEVYALRNVYIQF
jgi:hypothetical protein